MNATQVCRGGSRGGGDGFACFTDVPGTDREFVNSLGQEFGQNPQDMYK